MGKTFKRNSYHKPKQHGHVFEKKKDKRSSKKLQSNQDSEEIYVYNGYDNIK